jgi:hypothetical protein
MEDEPVFDEPAPRRPPAFDERLRNWSLLKRLLLSLLLLVASYVTLIGAGLMILLMLAFSTDSCQHIPDSIGFLVFQLPIYVLGICTALPALFLACARSLYWIIGSIILCGGLCAVWLFGGIIALVSACQ